MIYYKIRNRNNPDQFLDVKGKWHNHGKTFVTLGKLRFRLTTMINQKDPNLSLCEIVEYEVLEKRASHNIYEFLPPEAMMNALRGN